MGHKKVFNQDTGHSGGSPQLVEVIRNAIVQSIVEGRYPRGALLPTNPQIQQTWKVSARTSRRVLALLTEQGWAKAEGTRGYTSTGGPATADTTAGTADNAAGSAVAGGPPHPATHDPGPAAPLAVPRPAHTLAIGADIPAELSAVHISSAAYEPAPADVAAALRMDGPGLPVLVRRRVLTDPTGTIPLELRTSYIPGVPEHSPLAQPDPLPGTWTETLTTHTGHQPATATVRVNARLTTPYDAALKLPPGTCVITRTTTTRDAHGTPIDHTVAVWPEATTVQAEVPLT